MKFFSKTAFIAIFLVVNILLTEALAAPTTQDADNEPQKEGSGRLRKGSSTRRGVRQGNSRRWRNKVTDGESKRNNVSDGESNLEATEKTIEVERAEAAVAAAERELVTESKPGNSENVRHKFAAEMNETGVDNRFSITKIIKYLFGKLNRLLFSLSAMFNVRNKSRAMKPI